MTTAKKKTSTRKPATARKRATTKTKVQVVEKEVVVHDPLTKSIAEQTVDLSESLVNEIDNLMQSNLPPAQVGKVLGDIVSSFSNQISVLKKQLPS